MVAELGAVVEVCGAADYGAVVCYQDLDVVSVSEEMGGGRE